MAFRWGGGGGGGVCSILNALNLENLEGKINNCALFSLQRMHALTF